MKIVRVIGKGLKPFVNFPRWMGLKHLSENAKDITKIAKDTLTFNDKKAVRKETFEEAVKRLNLTEEAIQIRMRNLMFSAAFYYLVAAGLFVYAFYLLIAQGFFLAFIMTLCITWVALVFAYREHFWHTQMKHRRLGLSFKDWLKLTFRGGQDAK